MSRDYGDYLEDILYSIDAIEEFRCGLDLEDFLEDEKGFASELEESPIPADKKLFLRSFAPVR
ncbi:MAG: hypothetical protein R6U17_03330 [Thermoplasmata archaeon]